MIAQREQPPEILVDAGVLEKSGGRLRRYAQRLIGRILLRRDGQDERKNESGGNPEQ
jgi:hypothetical protein